MRAKECRGLSAPQPLSKLLFVAARNPDSGISKSLSLPGGGVLQDSPSVVSYHGDVLGIPPRQVFLVHGEPAAREAFRSRIEDQLGWRNVTLPKLGDSFELPPA